MRTSSTLLCFLALTCPVVGCQRGENGLLNLSIYARWPPGLSRSETARTEFLRRWRHTEVEVEDAEGRKERLHFAAGPDLRHRPCAELSLQRAGEYEVTVRLRSTKAVLLEGYKRVKVEKQSVTTEVALRAR